MRGGLTVIDFISVLMILKKFFQMIPVNEATVGDVSDELMIKCFASVLSPPTGIHSKILMKCFIRFTLSRRFPSPTILMENLT